jgi:hypothetical protein
MPTKRHPLNRRRSVPIDDETLRLFVELERTPKRGRDPSDDREWWAKDKELHHRLGLSSEWFCSCCSVTDRREEHHRLAAAKERGLLTAVNPTRTSRDPRLDGNASPRARESSPRPN